MKKKDRKAIKKLVLSSGIDYQGIIIYLIIFILLIYTLSSTLISFKNDFSRYVKIKNTGYSAHSNIIEIDISDKSNIIKSVIFRTKKQVKVTVTKDVFSEYNILKIKTINWGI